jgi:hypothetical protein
MEIEKRKRFPYRLAGCHEVIITYHGMKSYIFLVHQQMINVILMLSQFIDHAVVSGSAREAAYYFEL